VAGVGIQRNVGHDAQIRKVLFERRDHMGNQTYGIRRFFAIGRFKVATYDRKERHHGDA
jgi:hypothetical protein